MRLIYTTEADKWYPCRTKKSNIHAWYWWIKKNQFPYIWYLSRQSIWYDQRTKNGTKLHSHQSPSPCICDVSYDSYVTYTYVCEFFVPVLNVSIERDSSKVKHRRFLYFSQAHFWTFCKSIWYVTQIFYQHKTCIFRYFFKANIYLWIVK